MAKHNFKCKDCEQIFLADKKEQQKVVCIFCSSENIQKIFQGFNVQKEEKLQVGDLSRTFLEENKLILKMMREKKMETDA